MFFLIPFKEAGMKLSTSDLLEHWSGLVEMAKKIFFSRQSFVSSQWRKIFAALRTKGWSE